MKITFKYEVREPQEFYPLDEYYLSQLEEDEAKLVFMNFTEPCLALGRRQKEYEVKDDIAIMRKITNGTTNYVYKDEVSFAIYIKGDKFKDKKQSAIQQWIVWIVQSALNDLGVETEIVTESSQHEYNPIHCFSSLTKGELVYNGRKILGASSTRCGKDFIFHGLIYIDKSYEKIYNYIDNDSSIKPISVVEINSTLNKGDVIAAITTRVANEFDSI
jgi:lipoate-protein ligase A